MKRIIINIVAASSLALTYSCSKVLEVQPFDRISEDIVWSTKENAETFIYASYKVMEKYNNGPLEIYTRLIF